MNYPYLAPVGYEHIIYGIVAVGIAILFARKTDDRLLSFLLCYMIMAKPTLSLLSRHYSPASLPFDLHPIRIYIFIFIAYLFHAYLFRKNSAARVETPYYEYLLYGFYFCVFLALYQNVRFMQKTDIVNAVLGNLSFIIVYKLCRMYMTVTVLESILKAIVFTGVFASVIAIYQFLFDITFLNGGLSQYAFGSILRSNGIFAEEYILGYHLVLVLVILFEKFNSRRMIWLCVPVILSAIFLTFNRMNWVICILICAFYLIRYRAWEKLTLIVYVVLMVSVISALFLSFSSSDLGVSRINRAFMRERLKADTLNIRYRGFKLAFICMEQHPFGVGSRMSKLYDDYFLKAKNVPYAIHNGIIDAGVQYGILGMITIFLFQASLFIYFIRRIRLDFKFLIPGSAVIIWILSNLINSNIGFTMDYIIVVAILAGAYTSYCTTVPQEPVLFEHPTEPGSITRRSTPAGLPIG